MCRNLAHIIVIISRIVDFLLSLQRQHLLSVFLFLFAIKSLCFYFIWELRSSPSFFARLVKKKMFLFFSISLCSIPRWNDCRVWLSAAVTTSLCRRSAKFAPAWSWFFFWLLSSQLMQSYMGRINHVDKDWLFCIKKEGKKDKCPFISCRSHAENHHKCGLWRKINTRRLSNPSRPQTGTLLSLIHRKLIWASYHCVL